MVRVGKDGYSHSVIESLDLKKIGVMVQKEVPLEWEILFVYHILAI